MARNPSAQTPATNLAAASPAPLPAAPTVDAHSDAGLCDSVRRALAAVAAAKSQHDEAVSAARQAESALMAKQHELQQVQARLMAQLARST